MKFRKRHSALDSRGRDFEEASREVEEDSALDHEIWSEEEEGQVWAVSYADLLMVLLSFFIIFFSVKEQEGQDNKLSTIAIEIADQFGGQRGPGSVVQKGSEEAQAARESSELANLHPGMDADLMENIRSLSIVQSTDLKIKDLESSGIAIAFPTHIFFPGSFQLQGQGLDYLEKILKVLAKNKEDLSLTFVGHADPIPVKYSRSLIIQDNFDLSALRATWSLKRAKNFGFSDDQLFVRAESSNTLGARTISILVQPRSEGRTKLRTPAEQR